MSFWTEPWNLLVGDDAELANSHVFGSFYLLRVQTCEYPALHNRFVRNSSRLAMNKLRQNLINQAPPNWMCSSSSCLWKRTSVVDCSRLLPLLPLTNILVAAIWLGLFGSSVGRGVRVLLAGDSDREATWLS